MSMHMANTSNPACAPRWADKGEPQSPAGLAIGQPSEIAAIFDVLERAVKLTNVVRSLREQTFGTLPETALSSGQSSSADGTINAVLGAAHHADRCMDAAFADLERLSSGLRL